MAAGGLNIPRQVWASGRKLLGSISLVRLLLGVIGASAIFLLGWVIIVDDRHGGRPTALLEIDGPATIRVDSGESLEIRPTVDSRDSQPLPSGHSLPPADIVISDPAAGQSPQAGAPVSSNIRPSGIGGPDIIEDGKYGPLPAIAADGRRPSTVYARTLDANSANSPRIAILVGGMGLSAVTTEAAIDQLPAEVTLAFAPYGDEIDRLADRARQSGHELALQIPLEPYDYPDNDPGPHTLLTGLSDGQNRDRLHWVMSRFTGYVGVLNYMGTRFTASDEAFRPVLGELRDRGLLYLDDGTSPRSVAGKLSSEIGLPFAQADLVIDSVAARSAIDEELQRLETIATDKGIAFGVASGLPITIEAIAAWAKRLETTGIILIPVSAAAVGGQS